VGKGLKSNGTRKIVFSIRNPSGTAISGLLLKLHERQCAQLKSNPNTVWNFMALQFPYPLEIGEAAVIHADVPRPTICVLVDALYAKK
jgi:hypothetical protein